MAVELAVLAPLMLLLLLFLMACGRYFQTAAMLEDAARDGARAATQARSQASAQKVVDDAVARTVGQDQVAASCKNSAKGVLNTAGGFEAGEPITVEVSCTINYRDLGLLGLDKDVTLTRSFTSTLDPFRGVRG
jgi:Flp pilus assembly protein TadG